MLIDRSERSLAFGNHMPIELKVKAGVCFAHIGEKVEADRHLRTLLEQKVEEYSDLFYSTANALADLNYKDDALNFYQPLCCTGLLF